MSRKWMTALVTAGVLIGLGWISGYTFALWAMPAVVLAALVAGTTFWVRGVKDLGQGLVIGAAFGFVGGFFSCFHGVATGGFG